MAQVFALRRELVSPGAAQKVEKAQQIYAAELRSGWDSYYTVRAVLSGPDDLRHCTNVPAGAIEAARHGDVSRLVDCLRARKPMSDSDRDRLDAYIATKKRRRLWPPSWCALSADRRQPTMITICWPTLSQR